MIKLIELFSGVGTQFEAFKRNNLKCDVIGISEIDSKALQVYELLHGPFNNFGDITQIKQLPESDIWTYSFPCTNLSIAGKQEGIKIGTPSGLLLEVKRLLLCSPKPKVLIMENVKNLIGPQHLQDFKNWLSFLSELKYISSYQAVKSYMYGGPTIRDRVFCVSVLNGPPYVFPPTTGSTKTIRDILEPLEKKNFVSDYSVPFDISKSFTKAIKINDYRGGGQGNRIYSVDGLGITLTASGGGTGGCSGLYLRDEGICKLSGIEMMKLMGWTREQAIKVSKKFSDRDIGKLMGNAISVEVMTEIVRALDKTFQM